MFSTILFESLFAYHWHVTGRLLTGASRLDEAVYFATPNSGQRSIHDLLLHLLRTDEAWRRGLETGRHQTRLRAGDLATLPALQAGFAREQQAWAHFLSSLIPAEIEGDIELTDWRERRFVMPRWRVLQHVILHGMQHHAELAQLLTDQEQSPGDIDFIFFR